MIYCLDYIIQNGNIMKNDIVTFTYLNDYEFSTKTHTNIKKYKFDKILNDYNIDINKYPLIKFVTDMYYDNNVIICTMELSENLVKIHVLQINLQNFTKKLVDILFDILIKNIIQIKLFAIYGFDNYSFKKYHDNYYMILNTFAIEQYEYLNNIFDYIQINEIKKYISKIYYPNTYSNIEYKIKLVKSPNGVFIVTINNVTFNITEISTFDKLISTFNLDKMKIFGPINKMFYTLMIKIINDKPNIIYFAITTMNEVPIDVFDYLEEYDIKDLDIHSSKPFERDFSTRLVKYISNNNLRSLNITTCKENDSFELIFDAINSNGNIKYIGLKNINDINNLMPISKFILNANIIQLKIGFNMNNLYSYGLHQTIHFVDAFKSNASIIDIKLSNTYYKSIVTDVMNNNVKFLIEYYVNKNKNAFKINLMNLFLIAKSQKCLPYKIIKHIIIPYAFNLDVDYIKKNNILQN